MANKAAQKLRQTTLAFLVPPKLRTKGRFLSIGRLGEWGRKIREVLGSKAHGQDPAMLRKIRAALPDIEQAGPFIEAFAKTTHTVSQVMKVLKSQGLSPDAYAQCKAMSAQLPDNTAVKRRLDTGLDKPLQIQQRLNIDALPVSSDVIESLFGCVKHVIERSPQADMNRSALIISALCGNASAMTINESLSAARHTDLLAWDAENIPYTMRRKRQTFFRNTKPKTGENKTRCVGTISTA